MLLIFILKGRPSNNSFMMFCPDSKLVAKHASPQDPSNLKNWLAGSEGDPTSGNYFPPKKNFPRHLSKYLTSYRVVC